MISVRRICPGEWQLFRRVRLAALRESPAAFSSTYESARARSDQSWREQADASAGGTDRATFFALVDGSPAGIGAVYRDTDRPDEAEMVQVWVAPKFRGGTVAGELMDALVEWCKANGIRRVSAGVATGNDRALRFYAKHGFFAAGRASCGASGGTVLVRELGPARGDAGASGQS